MKHMQHFLKYIIVLLIIIVLLFIICYDFFKTKEGFDLKDIDNMFDSVKDITNVVGDIPNEINNINNKLTQQVNTVGNEIGKKTQQMGDEIEKKTQQMGNEIEKKTQQIGDEIEKKTQQMGDEIEKKTQQMGDEIEKNTQQMGKEIEKNTMNILTQKFKSVFTQLGDIFYKGIIKPILSIFIGIGQIFEQIFNILKEVSNKIISLPNCIGTYIIKESINIFDLLYDKIVPKFMRNIISFIHKYTFIYIFEYIGNITGYNKSVQKCYGFDISSEVDNINSSLKKIDTSFKSDFGQLDFSKIKI